MTKPYMVIEVRVSHRELVALRGDAAHSVKDALRTLLAQRGILLGMPESHVIHSHFCERDYDLFRQVVPRQESQHGHP